MLGHAHGPMSIRGSTHRAETRKRPKFVLPASTRAGRSGLSALSGLVRRCSASKGRVRGGTTGRPAKAPGLR
ncbi:hypothetical protein AKJ09_11406 [Labilithrix luteola]|uniref:Uncharacterized protein n=1 Tax=Labilithrix luteola TaxID=1391654 RepID=A0A0K1QGA4_9BACT|nr:hypothetical protein AKJ09_11406 [Labilithrix luteola]